MHIARKLAIVCIAFVYPAWSQTPPAAPDWTPLPIQLPEPMFAGTPRDLNTPNLEPVTGEKRKPFLAPPDTINVAAKKSVIASVAAPMIGKLTYVTDGDKRASDGCFLELPAGPQYVQVDLGALHTLYAIVLWHYHMEPRVYFDVVVKAADDPDFITNVKTLFNNDHDNSSGQGVGKQKEYIETNEGKLIDAGGVKTRYLRLYCNGNTSSAMNHYIEVEVYGKPAQ